MDLCVKSINTGPVVHNVLKKLAFLKAQKHKTMLLPWSLPCSRIYSNLRSRHVKRDYSGPWFLSPWKLEKIDRHPIQSIATVDISQPKSTHSSMINVVKLTKAGPSPKHHAQFKRPTGTHWILAQTMSTPSRLRLHEKHGQDLLTWIEQNEAWSFQFYHFFVFL